MERGKTRKTGETGINLVALAFPLFLVLLVAAATWKLTLGDRIIARGDLLLYFYPLRDYASQAVRELRLPLWNPYTFMGAPFLANSQVGFFYPFNILTAWLPVERAVSWQIALHLVIAALGAYALAVRGFKVGRLAGLATAIAFSLGGYLGAQVEHLNQLQVLAWLPLLILAIGYWQIEIGLGRMFAVTIIVALMITAGHTQSLYICLVTAGIVVVAQLAFVLVTPSAGSRRLQLQSPLRGLMMMALAVGLAVALCGIQLLPTLELARESARAGGLPFGEAASFSWRPWVIARALLPTYGDPLFPEYIAYFGCTGLALVVLGAVSPSPHGLSRGLPLVLALTGFILALGVVTPVFNVLYKFMPGFNLFRAQARWLVVFALGMSLLVGFGVQRLRDGLSERLARTWFIAWLTLCALLIVGLVVGARISLDAEYRSLPARSVMIGWAVTGGVTSLLIAGRWLIARRNLKLPITSYLFTFSLVAELLLASQFQPYARAADRQALTSLRPSVAHLLAQRDFPLTQLLQGRAASPPKGEGYRILALSSLFFDPGDKPEQTLIYGPQLSADELYDRIIASKHKEILSPNLPLLYRLPSIDGYDGGLLPTRRYADYIKQFARTPTGSVDGRLREFLKGVPDDTWLEQMGVRYIIADKTQDVFIDGVYYDLLFGQSIGASTLFTLAPYDATSLGLVLSATDVRAGDSVAKATIYFDGASQDFDIRATAPVSPYFGARLSWEGRRVPKAIVVETHPSILRQAQDASGGASLRLQAITSIDGTDQSFLSQRISGEHDMKLVHSGDVKIYENQRPALRALVREGVNELGERGTARIVVDEPERVVIEAEVTASGGRPAALILRDTCYPGWVARVDGNETPIACADGLFRGVPVSAGQHKIEFSYAPQSVRIGALISVTTALGLIVLGVVALLWNHTLSRGGSS